MTRIRTLMLLLIVFVAAPLFAARGSAKFTTFVAIGDSYGAGVESGSLNLNHQPFSWPAVIARQAGVVDFQQPLVSFPGVGNELQLVDIIKFPPTILPAAGMGQPINLNLPRPYNNLSVPGATVGDVITLTGKESATSTARAFAQFVLRGLGTEVDQALVQKPTFIAVWIGGNDALGAVLAGTPAVLTPLDAFKTSYNSMLDKLTAGAPGAGMVVGNIPNNVLALPYLSTVPPVLIDPATRRPVIGPNGQPISLVADLGGGTIGQLPAGSLVLLPASAKIASGYGIPSTLAMIPPFNQLPNVGKPLADSDVLTPAEQAVIKQRVDDFNTVIQQAAQQRDIPVADVKGLFDRVAPGMFVGPIPLSASFITGGFFSLDGFHLTDIGYTLFADEFIKTINNAYGSNVPLAPLTQFLANNIATTSSGLVFLPGMPYEVSAEAAEQMLMFAPRLRRARVVVH
ncbi:MAG TPA: SGNH/GDSL hydrolase family protein [Thermoanaerobaculia bacterium]|nr:SGNH/GDSL hydrolase family protein [Thermoanaerobaculia bacterium]